MFSTNVSFLQYCNFNFRVNLTNKYLVNLPDDCKKINLHQKLQVSDDFLNDSV